MTSVIIIIQLFVTIVMGLYFYNALKGQKSSKVVINKENSKEAEKLKRMKAISLTEPLTEKSRPTTFEDIIGQEKGIKALKAAICGPNPQHVIIYGPPGVGKTAAARLVLEAAKLIPSSPFRGFSKFVEIDATTIRFDERGIADPLIGSVHDPIYQGAGPLGIAGIPQPKPGAVTKAHGGILFLDEIGELHPIELNKLLKVLEDRKVFLDSAYYNNEDPNMPSYIKEIFEEGLPADFRLIGATTRSPEEIVPAIRSRCVEIFFRALDADEIEQIARNAVAKMGIDIDEEAAEMVGLYASNGRDAVNLVQLACGIVINEKRSKIGVEEVQWVIENGQYSPRPNKKVCSKPRVGYVNGLAVVGSNTGAVMEIEATARRVDGRDGIVKVTGIVEEEEIGDKNRKLRRRGTARNSIDNVLTVLERFYNLDVKHYDIHVNFPGGQPVDGPSAGISITTAIYSAITGKTIDNLTAMTGEISIHGEVKPVGGVTAKITGAIKAGAKKVIIPRENWQDIYAGYKEVEVIPMSNIKDVINEAIVSETVLHVNLENKDSAFGIMASPQMKA
ncbi:MAG: ATP-dependent protease LonB [Clostridium sp.]